MKYLEVDSSTAPIELLLEADPSISNIQAYLTDSWCYIVQEGDDIIGVCVVKPINESVVEIFNIAMSPHRQHQGLGTKLLEFVLMQIRQKGVTRIELGTGSFGYQLTYYQRLGFRIERVVKDHFLDNYAEPIFENGIQHKDMLRLYLDL
ncbi:GNAT family N-acetyltransferase [Enterovibrio sp. ZSDZ35]|uniref:GNAT family N-acetyltransferase n=1 Tax=Enterovibrio qingdaonensis TaxID=2899818 RepID=A0ABT5QJ80_9GAMM|nr:GNAT family N-acetyltransferase [Enterovibrio sp. ZSDZ35]MDD1780919.1 GNAT family N-acetyltransferase [Enterovibrio sp. ZSDZ35]